MEGKIATSFYAALALLVLLPAQALSQQGKHTAPGHSQLMELEKGFREDKAVAPSTNRLLHTVLFPQEREVGSKFFIEGIFDAIRLVYSCEQLGPRCTPPELQAMDDDDYGRSLALVFPGDPKPIFIGVVRSPSGGHKNKMASGVFFTKCSVS